MNIGIVGAGGMGCALANHLTNLKHNVYLYTPFCDEANEIKENNENKAKLPGIKLNEDMVVTCDKSDLEECEYIVIATPSQVTRKAIDSLYRGLKKEVCYICCSKGIEKDTKMLLYDVIRDVTKSKRICILTGPSHAEEIGKEIPTALVAAAYDKDVAKEVQDLFMNDNLRIYTSIDVVGVELGGSLKNVIALCAGISDGLNYGDNTKAALMTRGIAEITRLGVALGAYSETFSGLAGIGDLIVTCTSMHSRNRRAGFKIGQGMKIEEAINSIGMVVEGYETTLPAYELAKEQNVSMPIIETLYRILFMGLDAKIAVNELMTRSKKDEFR